MIPTKQTGIQEQEGQAALLAKRNPKIMIVDDNAELLEELERMLSTAGYDVIVVSDSAAAFEEALKNAPDILLLDLKMTPKSGFQIAHELRHSWLMKDVPIIAMTGFFTEKEHILMMKLCGIKSFILKPFNPVDLISKLEFALGRRTEEYDPEEA